MNERKTVTLEDVKLTLTISVDLAAARAFYNEVDGSDHGDEIDDLAAFIFAREQVARTLADNDFIHVESLDVDGYDVHDDDEGDQ